jgi:hypothetical protein
MSAKLLLKSGWSGLDRRMHLLELLPVFGDWRPLPFS